MLVAFTLFFYLYMQPFNLTRVISVNKIKNEIID
jgi:hypothetical protein